MHPRLMSPNTEDYAPLPSVAPPMGEGGNFQLTPLRQCVLMLKTVYRWTNLISSISVIQCHPATPPPHFWCELQFSGTLIIRSQHPPRHSAFTPCRVTQSQEDCGCGHPRTSKYQSRSLLLSNTRSLRTWWGVGGGSWAMKSEGKSSAR